MPTSQNSFIIHLSLNRDLVEVFKRQYQDMKILRLFLQKCFKKALNDKEFFDSIFFSEV